MDESFQHFLATDQVFFKYWFPFLCISVHAPLSSGQTVPQSPPVDALPNTCPDPGARLPLILSLTLTALGFVPHWYPRVSVLLTGNLQFIHSFVAQTFVLGFSRHVINIYRKKQRLCQLELWEKAQNLFYVPCSFVASGRPLAELGEPAMTFC